MLQQREVSNLNNVLVLDPEALYQGRHTVKEEIHRSIQEYLTRQYIWSRLGLGVSVLVKTRDDRILYPAEPGTLLHPSAGDPTKAEGGLDYMEIASQNYQILNEGLIASVSLQIRHNSWISNSILMFYVLISAWILARTVKVRIRQSEMEEAAQKETMQRLSGELVGAEQRLKELECKETEYRQKITQLHQDKLGLTKDIDALLEEIEKQEEGFTSQKDLREKLESETQRLRQELDAVKERVEKPKARKRGLDNTQKRFRVLYKNLIFTDRAVEGFLSLPEEYQLKAEEMIYRLNQNESPPNVRRKVFGKGGKLDVLEADFSYSGRLYFRKDHQTTKNRVIAVGTKNSQERDLAYIETVS